MSKLVLLVAIVASACATTGATLDQNNPEPRMKIRLDLSATAAGAARAFPHAIEPEVPSVNRLSSSVLARLGRVASAELELCVAPAGNVTKVTLARSSSYAAFDEALVHDARAWQFASLPGPTSVQSCRLTTIAYHAH
ncbi:MAG: energy transducer TonB [Kofleriaceae bacterium]